LLKYLEQYVVLFLSLGILIGLVFSALLTYTLDQGIQAGPAFSLTHHFTEVIGFLMMAVGFGLGFRSNHMRIKIMTMVVGIPILVVYSFLAISQIQGAQLPFGVPFFIPIIIVIGIVVGYIIGEHLPSFPVH